MCVMCFWVQTEVDYSSKRMMDGEGRESEEKEWQSGAAAAVEHFHT